MDQFYGGHGGFGVEWRHFNPQLAFRPLPQQDTRHPSYFEAGTYSPNPVLSELKYSYLVRIINPEQRSKYITKIWHNVHEKFDSPASLKRKLMESFEEKLSSFPELDFGYMEKRSNAKRWIEDIDDLQAMYNAYSVGDEITLWCSGRISEEQPKPSGRKRKNDETEDSTSSSSSKRAAKDEQIEQIVQKLREKHEDFSIPQLRLWARMKLGGQHESLDNPPQIPLFTGNRKAPRRDSNSLSDALTNAATAVVSLLGKKESPSTNVASGMSPAKRAHVSGQYLDHLEKLNKLFEAGVLTQQEFEEQKGFALKNIRTLNS